MIPETPSLHHLLFLLLLLPTVSSIGVNYGLIKRVNRVAVRLIKRVNRTNNCTSPNVRFGRTIFSLYSPSAIAQENDFQSLNCCGGCYDGACVVFVGGEGREGRGYGGCYGGDRSTGNPPPFKF